MCYLKLYKPLNQNCKKPLNLNGGCRGRGIRAALQRPKCWHLSLFHLHVLSGFQQMCYGGVNTVGFCCRQSRVKDDNKDLKPFFFFFFCRVEVKTCLNLLWLHSEGREAARPSPAWPFLQAWDHLWSEPWNQGPLHAHLEQERQNKV